MADYISREAVKEYLKRAIFGADSKIDKWVDAIPAADVKPVVRGHWVERKHATMYPDEYFCRMALSCSVCGHEVDYGRGYGPNYCGNCGADMREV